MRACASNFILFTRVPLFRSLQKSTRLDDVDAMWVGGDARWWSLYISIWDFTLEFFAVGLLSSAKLSRELVNSIIFRWIGWRFDGEEFWQFFDTLVWMRSKSWLIRNIFISCRFIKLASSSWNHIINFTFSRLIKISSEKVLFVNDRCRDYGIYEIRRFWLASWFIRLLVISYTQKREEKTQTLNWSNRVYTSHCYSTLISSFFFLSSSSYSVA